MAEVAEPTGLAAIAAKRTESEVSCKGAWQCARADRAADRRRSVQAVSQEESTRLGNSATRREPNGVTSPLLREPTSPRVPRATNEPTRPGNAVPDAVQAPDGWWDVGAGHAAAEAWRLGYRGDGVRVAVIDTGVDFAHPDLQGTWATLPAGQIGAGWPQVYDPSATLDYVTDVKLGTAPRASEMARGSLVAMAQTATPQVRNGRLTACFKPLLANQQLEFEADEAACDFVIPASAKGVVRYGHMPDWRLAVPSADLDADQEDPGVLLVAQERPKRVRCGDRGPGRGSRLHERADRQPCAPASRARRRRAGRWHRRCLGWAAVLHRRRRAAATGCLPLGAGPGRRAGGRLPRRHPGRRRRARHVLLFDGGLTGSPRGAALPGR